MDTSATSTLTQVSTVQGQASAWQAGMEAVLGAVAGGRGRLPTWQAQPAAPPAIPQCHTSAVQGQAPAHLLSRLGGSAGRRGSFGTVASFRDARPPVGRGGTSSNLAAGEYSSVSRVASLHSTQPAALVQGRSYDLRGSGSRVFSGWAQDLAFLGPDEPAHLLPWDELPAGAEGTVGGDQAAAAAPWQGLQLATGAQQQQWVQAAGAPAAGQLLGAEPEANPWQAWEAAALVGGWQAQPSDHAAGGPAELAGSGGSQQVWQQLPKTAAERLKWRLETVAAERQLGEALSMQQQLLAAEAAAAVEGNSDVLDRLVCIAGLKHCLCWTYPEQSTRPEGTVSTFSRAVCIAHPENAWDGSLPKGLFALSPRLDAVA